MCIRDSHKAVRCDLAALNFFQPMFPFSGELRRLELFGQDGDERRACLLYTSQILYELCIKCPMRFGELKKVLKPITNTALTNALKELESDELIQRIQYNEMPLRVEYSLTEKGRDLLPVFYAISQWGMKYIP